MGKARALNLQQLYREVLGGRPTMVLELFVLLGPNPGRPKKVADFSAENTSRNDQFSSNLSTGNTMAYGAPQYVHLRVEP